MKIIEYSQEPRHVEARKLYGGKLKLTSTGSWVTQFIEMVNSTYMLYLLLSPKAPSFWWAIVVVALAVSFLVQSFIRVNFSFLGRLTNDDKKDSEQRPEIAKSLFYGLVGCIAALSMTFGSAYFLSKSYNHTDKTDITALHSNYNEQFQEISRNFNEKTNSENKNNETVLSSISEKYDNKIKTVKTETDKQYLIDKKSKELKKQTDKHTANSQLLEASKNKDLELIETSKNNAISDAKIDNTEKQTAENKANNNSYYFLFVLSFGLVALGSASIYENGGYKEKCGITEINTNEVQSKVDAIVIAKTFVRRVFINRVKRIALTVNNKLGVELDDLIDNEQKPQTSNKRTNPSIVFTAPAEMQTKTNIGTTETNEPVIENLSVGNVVEFEKKSVESVVEQQNTTNSHFLNTVLPYLKGASADAKVEELINEFRQNKDLDLSSRRAGVRTYLKRFYEYDAKGLKSNKIKEQAQKFLANALYLIERGVMVNATILGGIIQIEIKSKK